MNIPLLCINTMGTTVEAGANKSAYCKETAAVAIKDAVKRVKHISGRNHVILTPHNAQVLVLRHERDYIATQLRDKHPD